MATSTAGTMTKASGLAASAKKKPQDLLEVYYKPKMCDIPATSTVQKPDPFDTLRPKPRTVLDYTISETDTKMQRKLPTGMAKVHLKQTTAEYVLPPPGYEFPPEKPPTPPPPEPLPVKHFTGGGPVWEFLDDIWRRKVEKKQKKYRENLRHLIAQNKKFEKAKKAIAHRQLMGLVGPDWYQELSPNQLKTVDKLKNCIVKDLKFSTIINTQENIAELGLVLRPDPRHVQMALNQCCECPVEFLLILYQLMNRHRTKYSLNDRLLLSAVVHLTMRETLKELHIRIPSPPPPPKQPSPPAKKEKIKRYKSPYLVPFTFKPQAAKHTGIYKNEHIQYPESPYFSYISELKNEAEAVDESQGSTEETRKGPRIRITAKQSGITDEQEHDIIAELRVAQQTYNELVDYEPVPLLHKPSIYIPCDHGQKEVQEEEEEEEVETIKTEEDIEEDTEPEDQTNISVKVEMKVTTDFGPSREPIRKTCECKITFDESKVPRYPKVESSSSSTGDESQDGDLVQLPAAPEIATKTVGVVTDNIALKMKIPTNEDVGVGSAVLNIPRVADASEKPESIDEEVRDGDEKLITIGQRESMECKCKGEVEKTLETRLCQCDRCKENRAETEEKKNETDIIPAVKEIEEGEEGEDGGSEASIIADIKANKMCNCMEKYQARVKMYEEMKKRFDTQHNLKTLEKQYIIGGVTQGPDGQSVYMLSGVKPERECPCAQIQQEQLKEEARLANMPQLPPGMQKYQICGVRETPEGNVYILSGAVPTPDCNCMKIYKRFQEKHGTCMEAYQQYLKKIDIDTKEYMEELAHDERYAMQETEQTIGAECEESDSLKHNEEAEKSQSHHSIESRQVSKDFKPNEEICEPKEDSQIEEQSSDDRTGCQCDIASDDGLETDTTLKITLELNKDKFNCVCSRPPTCLCEASTEPVTCTCGAEESEDSTEPDLTRFTILDKIPCNCGEQIDIIKKALQVLADDGYPLAKLPDSYRLPHFKLWMQFRCHKFWTQEDRVELLVQSWIHWRHAGYCSRRVKEGAKLSLSKADARKYTWAHAKIVRQMASEKDNAYYRQLRQAVIGDAREFFPSTFSYELPTPNFRDCYFAYTPAKEEECIAWRPWYPHEIKKD